MKRWIIWLLLLLLPACGQPGAIELNQGNAAFADADYEEALEHYREAQVTAPELVAPYYNAANTHYRQGEHDLVELRTKQALKNAESVEQDALAEATYLTLGNSFYQNQMYAEAAAAYEEVLWQNPEAEDARHNLEMALAQLQQQPPEDQQDQQSPEDSQEGDEEQEQENQEQEESDEGQEESEQNQQNQEEQSEEGDEDEQEQNQGGEDEGEDEQEEQEEQQPSSGQDGQQEQEESPQPQAGQGQPLSPEQAQQLLESIARDTESLQQYLQLQMQIEGNGPAEDW